MKDKLTVLIVGQKGKTYLADFIQNKFPEYSQRKVKITRKAVCSGDINSEMLTIIINKGVKK